MHDGIIALREHYIRAQVSGDQRAALRVVQEAVTSKEHLARDLATNHIRDALAKARVPPTPVRSP